MFTSDEITKMRQTQSAYMQDACKIGRFASTENPDGQPIEGWNYDATETACGFRMIKPREIRDAESTVTVEAEVRFATSVSLGVKDRIRITKRYGETVTNVDYDVIGVPVRGVSGLVAYVSHVEL